MSVLQVRRTKAQTQYLALVEDRSELELELEGAGERALVLQPKSYGLL